MARVNTWTCKGHYNQARNSTKDVSIQSKIYLPGGKAVTTEFIIHLNTSYKTSILLLIMINVSIFNLAGFRTNS